MAGLKKDRTGEKFVTNEGYNITIVEYFGSYNSTVQFEDGTLVEGKEYADIQKGTVKNPNHRSVHGVGYFGQGKYKSKNKQGKRFLYYQTWMGMIERCYCPKTQEKHSSYKGCSVDERWHNFQVFAEWFQENYNTETMQGWQLDKDLVLKGNKTYSPENCCFVPSQVNSILLKTNSKRGKYPIGVSKLGNKYKATIRKNSRLSTHLGSFDTIEEAFQAYKTAKEEYIKEIANKWRGLIDERVYWTLMNHQVQITD